MKVILGIPPVNFQNMSFKTRMHLSSSLYNPGQPQGKM